MKIFNRLASLFLCLFCANALLAQTPNIELTSWVTGLTSPIYVTHAGDQRLFIVEQAGRIRVKQPGSAAGSFTTFLDITSIVVSGGEKGLLGLAFHPDYKNNGYFYVNYTNNGGGASGKSVLARYSVNPADSNAAVQASGVVLDTIHQPYSNHNGGCIAFGPDGYLYMGMGDGGSSNDPQSLSQNLMSKHGKMLRYDVSNPNPPYYFVPADNPFVNNTNARPEIWSYGLRNPWRFSFDRCTGDLWIGDVGQNAREEINLQPATSAGGENYGWRCYEASIATPTVNQTGCPPISQTVLPVHEYLHTSGTNSECSVTGGYVYRGVQIGAMHGHYIFTDYCSGKIRMLSNDGNYTATQLFDGNTMTSFGEDIWGELYVCSNNNVFKITSPDCEPDAFICSDDVVPACPGSELTATAGQGFTYQWHYNNQPLNGQNNAGVVIADTGFYYVVVTNALGCTAQSNAVEVVESALPTTVQITTVGLVCHDSFGTIVQATPAGGTFSGTGIDASGYFNPANATFGTQTVYYTYIDTMACHAVVMDTATFEYIGPVNIAVSYNPVLQEGVICSNEFTQFTASPTGGFFSSSVGQWSNDVLLVGQQGPVTVYYSYTDTNNCNTVQVLNLTAELCGRVGETKPFSLVAHPNPVNDALQIQLPGFEAVLTLTDCTGKVIYNESLPAGTVRHEIPTRTLANGLYLLRLTTASVNETLKIVKSSE